MICVAKKNNILNGALHYRGDVIEAHAVPNENWESVDGQQYVDEAVVQEPQEPQEPQEQAADEPEQPSEDHTVAQLKELAAGRGIEVPNRATKADILAMLG